jgi:hypothetical protein
MGDLSKRVSRIESKLGADRDPLLEDMPFPLIHLTPHSAELRDEIAAAVGDHTLIIIPPGRSIMRHDEDEYEPARKAALAMIKRCAAYFKPQGAER